MQNPMVSVLVASYNYERYLGDTIRSVLAQTWGDFELLVIDDGSRDGSVELARSFVAQDDRVRVIRHPDGKNHGLPAT
ncbi:MAG: glycosyltransferase family 2 protein, partial [Oscillospiraceae bacterium]|nr:glycosyltransferase family 2 protein [Oscillospiraceae bacterium]